VCPGLVELVEKGTIDGPEVRSLLEAYLEPARRAEVDAVVLGCTHYPFLKAAVEEMVGPGVSVLDSGAAVARQVGRVLEREGLLRASSWRGDTVFYSSSPDAEHLAPVFARLSGQPDARVLFAAEAS
jgi:glutamate racemase